MVVRGGPGPGQPIVYNHAPRTAGTSFIAALVEALRPQNAFFGFDRSTFGPFTGFDQLAPDIRARLALDPEDVPAYADAVMGQLSPSTTRARFADAHQLTILREPRTRIVSHWLSWRAQNAFTMRGWGDWVGYARLARAPLSYFLDDPDAAFATDNMLTRFLVWPHPLTPEDDFIDPAHDDDLVEAALATLRRFDFVGVTEDQLVAERLARHLGLDADLHPALAARALVPRRSSRFSLTEECDNAAELLEQRSRLDAALWDHAAAATYLPRQAVEQERTSLYRAAVEHYELSSAEGQAPRHPSAWGQVLARGRNPRGSGRPPVLSP